MMMGDGGVHLAMAQERRGCEKFPRGEEDAYKVRGSEYSRVYINGIGIVMGIISSHVKQEQPYTDSNLSVRLYFLESSTTLVNQSRAKRVYSVCHSKVDDEVIIS